MPTIEQLYESAEKISSAAKDKRNLFSEEYKVILSGVKELDSRPKQLASQFIARFFTDFPDEANSALDAILDLCEDDEVAIRKQAVKDLATLCRDKKEYLPKIADILCQLLQSDDEGELLVIQSSLMSLFRKDPKGTIVGLFSQIREGGEPVRERAIKFLYNKMTIEKDLLPKDAEVTLLKQIRSSVKEVSAEEFHFFMSMLNLTSIPKLVSGQSQLLEICSETIDLEKDFDGLDEECVGKFVSCGQAATGFMSSAVKSTKLVEYICMKILPQLHAVTDLDAQTSILKILAEAAMYTSDVADPKTATMNVFQRLLDFMPIPPEDAADSMTDQPEFEFTKVECLLLTFHRIGRQHPEYLTDDADRLKDFRARLQYFARGCQAYIKKLKEYISKQSRTAMDKEENKLKAVALKCTTNITVLIRDLFHTPPSYKTNIIVSWKADEKKGEIAKKRTSITFDKNGSENGASAAKQTKNGNNRFNNRRGGAAHKGVYQPPSGKFSSNIKGNFEEESANGGGRGGGRGGRSWRF